MDIGKLYEALTGRRYPFRPVEPSPPPLRPRQKLKSVNASVEKLKRRKLNE